MTSEEAADVHEAAQRRWFSTALRARLDDGERLTWKNRFCARAVLLIARWGETRRREARHGPQA